MTIRSSAIGNVSADTPSIIGMTASWRSRGRAAFTILEILMVIGLISMLTGVMVTGAIHLTRDKAVTPEDVFWKAVSETRRMALISGREVKLSFIGKDNVKERALVARSIDGTEQRFVFEQSGELSVDFLALQKGGSSILLGGQLVETQTIQNVTFYGDGTCSPFRLQLRTGGAARILAIDPWTCSLVLPAANPQH